MNVWKMVQLPSKEDRALFPMPLGEDARMSFLKDNGSKDSKVDLVCSIFLADDLLLCPTGSCLYWIANETSKRIALEQWIGAILEKLMAGPLPDFELK